MPKASKIQGQGGAKAGRTGAAPEQSALAVSQREREVSQALDRVLDRAMKLRQSSELRDVISQIFNELKGIGFDLYECNIMIWEDRKGEWICWEAGLKDAPLPQSYRITPWDHPYLTSTYDHFKKGSPYREMALSGKESRDYLKVLFSETDYKNTPKEYRDAALAVDHVVLSQAFMQHGVLEAAGSESMHKEEADVLKRFARVVDLTYTRFLDLKKAEIQAQEARTEAALERVRAVALSMNEPADMLEVCRIITEQLEKLSVRDIRNVQTAIIDESKGTYLNYEYYRQHDKSLITEVDYKHPEQAAFVRKMLSDPDGFFYTSFEGESLREWYDYQKKTPQFADHYLETTDSLHYYWHSADAVALGISTYSALDDEGLAIFKRFRNVFELAYRRYSDVALAVAQAREARIEAALEKVRSHSMGMQKSEELTEVIQVVFDQLVQLNIHTEHAGFIVDYKERDDMNIWLADPNGAPSRVTIPYFDSPHWNSFNEAKGNGTDFFSNHLNFEEKNRFYQELFQHIPDLPEESREFYMRCPGLAISTVLLDDIGLYIENFSGTPYSDEENDILMRFGKVFQQAYTRFLDLQKAEDQAREAQIETALERIRSRTMAMRHSDELMETSGYLFSEFVQLGAKAEQLSIGIIDGRKREIVVFGTFQGNQLDRVYKAKADDHPVITKLFELWENKEDKVSDVLIVEGEELSSYHAWRKKLSRGTFDGVNPERPDAAWIIHIASFKQGVLSLSANEQAPPETMQLLVRFARQFEQTYTRFLDLQKAEAQAREAVKQASLDRVRGEIASMRSAEDLLRMPPILFDELTTLDVPFFRCGVFILDPQEKHIDAYLSGPQGEALAAWRSEYDSIPLFAASVKAWQKQEVFGTEWDRDEFATFSRIMADRGLIKDADRYLGGQEAPDHLSLHLIPFVQGMLFVGNTHELTEEQIDLVRSLADTFSIAYARFDDFRLLEKANKQIKDTLEELRSTQDQLIHAEKMASLGELTAGIAHEIQNPLNFVNNFSEVSVDMIEELKAETRLPDGQGSNLPAGQAGLKADRDSELEEEILDDVVENLNKIRHHGQRASSIVKGMLEHSRTGAGKMEPTDINALADEYLRLAYHGLRAKDKSFNADFSADLDENLPKINVVSQDIGRVLLNLINNAFYAVSKKAKAMPPDEQSQYKPTVSVKTRMVGDGIEIRVTDNADGIPKDVLDKIFQPFFTTKPTGQGTGLGLSLSYDIVTKGHNGHLEVDTQKGIGTCFIVSLPAGSNNAVRQETGSGRRE